MTELFKNKFRVQSARLPGYDYGQPGFYFVTICTELRVHYFGRVVDGEMVLSAIGQTAMDCWSKIPEHFPHVMLDEFMIMPNHVHGIIIINHDAGGIDGGVETQNFASLPNGDDQPYHNKFGPQSKNLSSIIRGFKIGVKKWTTTNGVHFAWQPRFYDHIIRDEMAYFNVRQYIINNPTMWNRDRNNPDGLLM